MGAVIERLTGLLAGATEHDLAELDAEIARLQALRQLLAGAVAGPPAPAPAAPRAEGPPAPAEPPSGQPAPAAPRGPQARRLQVARLLAAGGPTGALEIGQRCGIPKGSVGATLACDWFEKGAGGRKAPWGLTAAGRAALAGAAEAGAEPVPGKA